MVASRTHALRAAATSLAIAGLAACGSSSRHRAEPIDVEVRAPTLGPLARPGASGFDQAALDAFAAHPDVVRVVPHLAFDDLAMATAAVAEQQILLEVGGFTDGIPVSAVADDPAVAARFVDLDPGAPPGRSCTPAPEPTAPPDPFAASTGDAPDPCPAHAYCDGRDQRCHPRVPVLVSPTVVTLYRDEVAGAHGLPSDSTLDELVARGRLQFTITLGRSTLTGLDDALAPSRAAPPRDIGAVVIGVSPRAIPIGMTAPIGHVAAWIRDQRGADAPTAPAVLVITLRDRRRLDAFTRWARDQHGAGVEPVLAPAPPARAGDPPTGASAGS